MNIIKELPKIYKNNIDKNINNNKQLYYSGYSNNNTIINTNSDIDVDLLIDGIFNNKTKVYNIPIIINTSNKIYDTYLVARTSNYLLTINQERIFIKDIISIKRKNP